MSALKKAAGLVGAPFSHVGGGMEWFPAYGCALLALPTHSTQAAPEQVKVLLVGLDAWEFRLHRWADSKQCWAWVGAGRGAAAAHWRQAGLWQLRHVRQMHNHL
jgi:hypothetical protein